MSNNLIYYVIYDNKEYVKILNKSIDTLIRAGYTGDILIITNLELRGFNKIKNSVYIMQDKVEKKHDSYLDVIQGKYKIWKFNLLKNYNNVIYCDCDIFWLKHPDKLFNQINKREISLSCEINNVLDISFFVYELEKFAKANLPEMNAGVFGFNTKNIQLIKDIYNFLESLEQQPAYSVHNDQPLLNAYLYSYKLYNTNFNGLVGFLNNFENTLDLENNVLIHFFGEDFVSLLNFFSETYKKILDLT